MNTNAPGQLLGYTMQFSRALLHLMQSGPGDAVCMEVLGDVATIKANGTVTTEEDKSSIISNPLTNKSTDLWKTFFNWISAINAEEIVVNKTFFILYANKQGRNGIVNLFHLANTKDEIQEAIKETKRLLKDIKKGHPIWDYYSYVVNNNEAIFSEIIQRFELQVGTDDGYGELEQELIRQHIPQGQVPFFLEGVSGWLLKTVTEKIAAKKPAIIYWDEYHKHMMVLFGRFRSSELIDFTYGKPFQDSDIEQQVKIRPCYLKQLDAIDYDDILEAVSDYLRAKVNRDIWIENGTIDENTALDFQKRLVSFWQNQKKRIEITQKDLNDKEIGQVILMDCKNRQELIRGEPPPLSTVAGTYHTLADERLIGWHPNWEKLFLKTKDEEI